MKNIPSEVYVDILNAVYRYGIDKIIDSDLFRMVLDFIKRSKLSIY